MRGRTFWLAGLLAVGLAGVPGASHAQTEDGAVPDPIFPLPIYHNHPGKGGFYAGLQFVMYRQTNPLENQPIAFRGVFDANGTLTGRVGQFIGGGEEALNAKDAGGPGSYMPGFKTILGWRFRDGITFEAAWTHLARAQYGHTATIIPPIFNLGAELSDSFLTAPVYNFPNDYAGPRFDLEPGLGFGEPTYGVWNGADVMQITFVQKTEILDLTFRVPIHETDCWRSYGITGGRFFWIWERFKWRTVDQAFDGQADSSDVAYYTNIVSNRMYGPVLGWGNEYYMGAGFAMSLDVSGAVFLDVVKQRAKYSLEKGVPGIRSKRSVTDYSVVPEVQAGLNIHWYPIEGIQFRLGWDVIGLFNTFAAPKPVAFDFGGIDPPWERRGRLFDGLNFGMAIIF